MSELRNMSEADKKWLKQQIRSVVREEGMKPSTEKALRWFVKRQLDHCLTYDPFSTADGPRLRQEAWNVREEMDKDDADKHVSPVDSLKKRVDGTDWTEE